MTIHQDLSSQSYAILDRPSAIVGSGNNYVDHDSFVNGVVVDSGDIGVKVYLTPKSRLVGLDIKNVSGNGVDYSGSQAWQDICQLSEFHIQHCYRGIYAHDVGEALIASQGHISNCVFGIVVDSGNVQIGPVQVVMCSVGMQFLGGTNAAHGTVAGALVRHCFYLLSCSGVSLGQNFEGCIFVGGQDSSNGKMQFINSQGININGGQISYADLTIDATSQIALKGVVFRGTVSVTVTAGGVLDAKDNMVMPGATVTLNGSAWSGNN